MLVYLITNKVNGKVYVGKHSGDDLFCRWRGHVDGAKRGVRTRFYAAVRKYGEQNFVVELLDTCETEVELNRLERFYIRSRKSHRPRFGYNMTLGGDGTAGLTHSLKTKRKISTAHVGITHTSETKAKLHAIGLAHGISDEQRARMQAGITEEGRERSRKARLGKKHTLEARAKIGERSRGHEVTEETRAKLRAAHAGKHLSEETREKIRNANVGKKHSLTTKRKMSAKRRGKKRPPAVGQKVRCWIQSLTPEQRLERMRPCFEARAKRKAHVV